MKQFKGKAIYQPAGKAAEYAEWACNFYVGCSNGCTYCYLKKGCGCKILGGDKPTLKKCFKDENHAYEVFRNELIKNLAEIKKHGLFLSFTTDPMLPETIDLTLRVISTCAYLFVPTKILTKKMEWIDSGHYSALTMFGDKTAFGFTLTGYDELEPNASPNVERISAMEKLHKAGFKIFASIEPIIDFESSFKMIAATYGICDLYKVGLESGKKYDKDSIELLVANVLVRATENNSKVYFKDSILKCLGKTREYFKEFECCVERDYNIFKS